MSETEEATGADFTLANAGLTRAPTEPQAPEPKVYGSGIDEIKRAANDHTAERGWSDEAPPIKRELQWQRGEKAGQIADLKKERMSLTPEAAAKTLTEAHRLDDQAELDPQLRDLAAEVDYARAVNAGAAGLHEQPAQSAQPDAPQPESVEQPPIDGIDPEVSKALQNPKIRGVIEQVAQQAEQARQAFAGQVQQAAETALHSLIVNFPELQGYNGQQLGTVIQHIARENPERAALIQDQIQKVSGLATAAQQARPRKRNRPIPSFKTGVVARIRLLMLRRRGNRRKRCVRRRRKS